MKIENCARCGENHEGVEFITLKQPFAPAETAPLVWGKWAPCPTTGEPILMRVDPAPGAAIPFAAWPGVLPASVPLLRTGALIDVAHERIRQIAKWGDGFPDGGFMTMATVLGEEYGEACQAALKGDAANRDEELVQIAAVAVRMLEQLRRGEKLPNREG